VARATGLSRRARADRTHELDVPAEFESIKSPEELHSRVGEHLEVGSCDAREQQQIHKGRTLPLTRVQAVFQARLGEWPAADSGARPPVEKQGPVCGIVGRRFSQAISPCSEAVGLAVIAEIFGCSPAAA
jgi:hypothetical protein